MSIINPIQAQYDKNYLIGRSELCPRKGVYRFLKIYDGRWHGKPAVLATVNWKQNLEDFFTNVEFTIQIESLRTDPDNKAYFNDLSLLIGKQIIVNRTDWYSITLKFEIDWRFVVPSTNPTLFEINAALKQSRYNIDLNAEQDLDIPEDFGDDYDYLGGY